MSTKYVPNTVFNTSVVYKTIGLKEIKTKNIYIWKMSETPEVKKTKKKTKKH